MNFFVAIYSHFASPKKYARNRLSFLDRAICFFQSLFKTSKFREADNELHLLNKETRLAISKAKETGITYSLHLLIEKYKSLSNLDIYNLMFSDKGKTFYQVLYEYFLTIETYKTLKTVYEEKEYTYEEIAEELGLEKEYDRYNNYSLKELKND